MFNRLRLSIFTVIFFLLVSFVFGQAADGHGDNISKDTKFTTINFLISQITDTPEGTILEYRTEYKSFLSTLYIPHSVFQTKKAIKVVSNTPSVRNQMNLILRDGKPDRLKVYVPPINHSSSKFLYKNVLSQEDRNEFAKIKSFEDLVFVY